MYSLYFANKLQLECLKSCPRTSNTHYTFMVSFALWLKYFTMRIRIRKTPIQPSAGSKMLQEALIVAGLDMVYHVAILSFQIGTLTTRGITNSTVEVTGMPVRRGWMWWFCENYCDINTVITVQYFRAL